MNKMVYMLLLTSAFLFNGCSGALDVAPDGTLDGDDVWEDPNMVESKLNSCYNQIPQRGYRYYYWDNNIIGLTDDAVTGGTGGPTQLVYSNYVSASYHPLRDSNDAQGADHYQWWTRCWEQIRLCTQFIEHIDFANVRDEAGRQRMRAEAHVLRAYFYSELVKWFGKVPLVDPMMSVGDDFSSLRRESVYTVAKYIETDCMMAINTPELPWRITVQTQAMRVTKALAYTLRAKMLLYAASPLHNEGQDHWREAYEAAKEAVSQLKANGYQLFTECTVPTTYGNGDGAAYRQLMCTSATYQANPADRETIWQHSAGIGIGVYHINYIGSNLNGTNKCGPCPTQELIDAFDTSDGVPVLDLEQPYLDEKHLQPNYNPDNHTYDPANPYKNRDPRMYETALVNGDVIIWDNEPVTVETNVGGKHGLTLDPSNTRFTRTGYYHQKFVVPGSSSRNPVNSSNWKMYRLAEVILDYAEAAAEYGELAEAKGALDEIRARVNMPPLPDGLSQEEMILRVRKERRTELAWEEQRYFDLRRWQKPDGDLYETCKWVTAMQITKNSDGTFLYTRVNAHDTPRGGSDSKDLLLPLPFDEANRLEYLTGVSWQNSGW